MRTFNATMIKYPLNIKKPEIGQINAKKEPQAETPAAFWISLSVLATAIITPEQKKSKTGNGARMAEFRDVRPLSAFLA